MKRTVADFTKRSFQDLPNFKGRGPETEDIALMIPGSKRPKANEFKLWSRDLEIRHKFNIRGRFLSDCREPLVLRAFGGDIDKQKVKDNHGTEMEWLEKPSGAECELSFDGAHDTMRHRMIIGRFPSFLDQSISSDVPQVLTDGNEITKALGRIIGYYRDCLRERIDRSNGEPTESIALRAYFIRKMIRALEISEVPHKPPTVAIVYPEKFSKIPTLALSIDIRRMGPSNRRDNYQFGNSFEVYPLNYAVSHLNPSTQDYLHRGFYLGSQGFITNKSERIYLEL